MPIDLGGRRIPPPTDAAAFERLCLDFFRETRGWHGLQRYGRNGQKQFGVDLFAYRADGRLVAVQCKATTALSAAVVRAEVAKAGKFPRPIAEYVIATTAQRDRVAADAASAITAQHAAEDRFPVSIVAWEDVLERLGDLPNVAAKHFRGLVDVEPDGLENHLVATWAECLPVKLLGVRDRNTGSLDVPLAEVYTALDVTRTSVVEVWGQELRSSSAELIGAVDLRIKRELIELRKRHRGPGAPTRHGRRWTAVEAIGEYPRLVLKGPPGSGKSTFARYLALSLAGERLGREEADLRRLEGLEADASLDDPDLLAWPHGALVPIFVELRAFVRSEAFPATEESASADDLVAFLAAKSSAGERFARWLRKHLDGGVLLILDGLDETPSADEHRERIKAVVASLVRSYPKLRILVTSRPYAYEPKSRWRLDDLRFAEAELADLDDGKVRAYVEGWYRFLATARRQLDEEAAKRRSARLIDQLRTTPYLARLAVRPLLLAMMADLHANEGALKGGRTGVYERSVEMLFDRWNEARPGVPKASDSLGLTTEQVREALEALAYDVHGTCVAGEDQAARIDRQRLLDVLDRLRERDGVVTVVDYGQIADYLDQRSGILVAESERIYRFPHRSFQEFLAACHFQRDLDFPDAVVAATTANPALWREVVQFAIGLAASKPRMAWNLIGDLVAESPADESPDDPTFSLALYAALAIDENPLFAATARNKATSEALERVRSWLERSLVLGALSPVDRAAAGRIVNRLGGDRRPGVGVVDGVPDIVWRDVPGGPFRMGSLEEDREAYDREKPQQTVEVSDFQIAEYPVTNAQFAAFVDAGGYAKDGRRFWTDEGWAWKGDREGPDDDRRADFLLPNHPRVNVCWFEADAFGRWLAEARGEPIRLPTEAEWEKAARGTEGRIYPWGNPFDAERCNVDPTGIGQTSAVGMFPTGASPCGALDMTGNVAEWVHDWYAELAGGEDPRGPESGQYRVFRGGSFFDDPRVARVAYRGNVDPSGRYGYLGFRVARS